MSTSLSDKTIHVISFSIPFPANYGGVIDVFYKVKALKELGVKVILHCFQYDREPAEALEDVCSSVHYYPRKMVGAHMLNFLPFIVSSRKSEALLENLKKDSFPILFEGLHSCYYINHPALKDRKKLLRSHNIEHDYYAALAEIESNPFKKFYFKSESKKLARFEGIACRAADVVLGISNKDYQYLNEAYGNAVFLSAFHAFKEVTAQQGKGTFVLYHGNLSVGENNEAALFLVNEVFNDLKIPLKIAGSGASKALKSACDQNQYVTLLEDLNSDEIHNFIAQAQLNVLPTFQATGIKLKLLAALFLGRHCVVNAPMVEGTGLESLCLKANSPKSFKEVIEIAFDAPFTLEQKNKRTEVMEQFSNLTAVKKLLSLV